MKHFLISATLALALASLVSAPGQAWAQTADTVIPPPADIAAGKSSRGGPIEVVVWNIRKSLGHVRVAICTKMTFANAKKTCPYHGEAVAQSGSTKVVVPDVPAGTYAVQVFQDEKDRNQIARGPFGIPLEGVGFSNDAPVKGGPPKFEDAAFDHDPSGAQSLSIKLRYFPNL